ncbi:hypothetical protein LUZ60_001501 [Juncus effusus]|nr:hypothetical protein LUZ60_001501 [Juncus effusus]
MEIQKRKLLAFIFPSLLPFFLFLLVIHQNLAVEAQNATPALIRVGVVLDLDSLAGKLSKTSISMAIEDFYAINANFNTRVVLEYRDSMSDVVSAASAALDLLKNSEVQAIIGPQTSVEAEFVANMCNRSQVPLLSFSASSPSISPSHLPFFVRATINDSSQSIPIASFIQYFDWRTVVPIYEDSDYGSGIIPSLVDALQSVGTNILDRAVVPIEATDDYIDAELYRLMTQQTRVFIVHMIPELASRLFFRAQLLNMVSSGYVWIVTDGVGNMFETLNTSVIRAMEGVIGFRPYVVDSNKINNFSIRFKTRFLQDNPGMDVVNPNAYQLWAYDAVWAMAKAVEMANITNPSFVVPQRGVTDLSRIGISQIGQKLLRAILNNSFIGLTGEFMLVDNQLQLSTFEIFNVVGKSARTIGFWSQYNGIIHEINSSLANTKINNSLKSIVWPGDSTEVPRGWVLPTGEKKLRILVPILKEGFNAFVNISGPVQANVSISGVSGYCIDIFKAVLSKLPYAVSYEFYPFVNSTNTYDNMVYQVYLKNYDAFVGDTTIRFNRTNYVDFTMPYTQSGVLMVVPIKPDASTSMWIFLKPLTTTLWLTSLAFFFFTGFVVWLIEHRINPEFRGTPCQQSGLIFYFAFSTPVFAHKEKLKSNLSRFVVIIWVFVVLILTSSYTASLTSMLTVQQLTPTVTDINQLIKNGDYVGYQDGSFVKGLLINLGLHENKLKNYSTTDEYVDALSKGSAYGGVAAIFDEIPCLKVFLSQHCDQYTMTGPTYKTDGFAFVLPRGSPLLPDMSRAVLNVTEGPEMIEIERNWFGESATCPNQSADPSSSSLSFRSFAGLFIITGSVSGLMLLIYLAMFIYKEKEELISMITPERSFLEIVKLWFGHYDGIDRNSPNLREYIRSSMNPRGGNQEGSVREVNLTGLMGSQSPVSISNPTSEMNFEFGQGGTLTPPEIGQGGTLTPPEIGSPSPSNRGLSEEVSAELTVER